MSRASRSSEVQGSLVQGSLFPAMPPGLGFRQEFVDAAEEARLIDEAARLPFKPFEFHGWTGNRETASFGWRYDFNQALVLAGRAAPLGLPVDR